MLLKNLISSVIIYWIYICSFFSWMHILAKINWVIRTSPLSCIIYILLVSFTLLKLTWQMIRVKLVYADGMIENLGTLLFRKLWWLLQDDCKILLKKAIVLSKKFHMWYVASYVLGLLLYVMKTILRLVFISCSTIY